MNRCPPKAAPCVPIALGPLPERPLLSIVIPSFNQGKYIRATLNSILSQGYRPLQVIVMDGASKDETVDVLRSYAGYPELEWTSEPDLGVVDAVNKGFALVRGDLVAIQSSDDCYLPDVLDLVVRTFLDDPELGLLYGDTVKIDGAGNDLARSRIGPYSLLNLLRIKTWIPQPSAFFRRELLTALGGWDERIPYAPDTDLWYRMAFRTKLRKLDEYLSQRRVHAEQRDTQAAKIARDYAKMIEQSPDIAAAGPEIRGAAHAGKHLVRVRYNASGSDWATAWNLWQAGRYDPSCRQLPSVLRHIAWSPIRRVLSRWKRRLLRLPSSS
jgi:glycosyltransferase involved in cell wall biosynthesis